MASFLVNVPLTQPIDIDSNNGKFLLESLPKAEIPPEVSELFETLRGEALRRAFADGGDGGLHTQYFRSFGKPKDLIGF